jgi:hypothetical protein
MFQSAADVARDRPNHARQPRRKLVQREPECVVIPEPKLLQAAVGRGIEVEGLRSQLGPRDGTLQANAQGAEGAPASAGFVRQTCAI